ncbi:hypothetical protein GCM10009682_10430 [Luedemannella flava]|uniref:DUF2064 domain-containing protein n=1 Tax=Luedemannella flava TaxID=349316 RepID=A0ABN2LJ02_9ACTN
MTRRVAAAVLTPPTWTPPGIDPVAWRIALAEDLLDVLALMAEVEPAVVVPASEVWLRSEVGWPGLPWYAAASPRLPDLLRAVAGPPVPPAPNPAGAPSAAAPLDQAAPAGGAPDQVALIAADAPDLPGLVIAKLLRPLTTRPFAAAPAVDGGPGLLGVASRLPAPDWLPDAELDALDVLTVRRVAPQLTDVVSTAGWHRLRGPEVLAALDPRLEGWDATRALLNG